MKIQWKNQERDSKRGKLLKIHKFENKQGEEEGYEESRILYLTNTKSEKQNESRTNNI